jgi:hypothetical protein
LRGEIYLHNLALLPLNKTSGPLGVARLISRSCTEILMLRQWELPKLIGIGFSCPPKAGDRETNADASKKRKE